MHELSIALSILEMAAEVAKRHGGGKVHAIHLRLGPLAGVVKEALLSAHELARETQSLENAALIIEETTITVRCAKCLAVRPVVAPTELCCIQCGTPASELVSGRELEVVAMEIE